jgi:hypothetical protein
MAYELEYQSFLCLLHQKGFDYAICGIFFIIFRVQTTKGDQNIILIGQKNNNKNKF